MQFDSASLSLNAISSRATVEFLALSLAIVGCSN